MTSNEMTISPDVYSLLAEEERILSDTIAQLRRQIDEAVRRMGVHGREARRLTSAIVATTRDEEKQMLASDEAVAHGVTKRAKNEIEILERLCERPYIARIVLEEETPSGHPRKIEYKIGTAANVDCRIVDWRHAPLSKLYYELREGEDYAEMIQGRERIGRVLIRNRVEIEHGELRRVSCRYGDFHKSESTGDWQPAGGRGIRKSGGLPDVLSLITAEQFRAITEEAKNAVIVQGVAGSGKTTVALHRLSWLLHNSELNPKEILFVVRSRVLKRYVETSLSHIALEELKVRTYEEWIASLLGDIAPARVIVDGDPTTTRVLRSEAVLRSLREAGTTAVPLDRILPEVLRNPENVLRYDRTKLLDAALLRTTKATLERARECGTVIREELPLLLRIFERRSGGVRLENREIGKYAHVVMDEVQDFSLPELATLFGAAKSLDQMTLAGDALQDTSGSFTGWSNLTALWQDSMPKVVSLTVSHRSTLPIMRLADHISGERRTTAGRPGRLPLWFRCLSEQSGLHEGVEWLSRVNTKFPGSITAVLCRDLREARYVSSLLEPSFGGAVRLGDDNNFSFDEGIVVAPILSTKGIEFQNVLLWNPAQLPKNLLYVGVTRAEELLTIVSWGKPSPLLPGDALSLMRVVEEEIGESEERAEQDEFERAKLKYID